MKYRSGDPAAEPAAEGGSTTEVEVRDLTKTFGRVTAVRGMSFTAPSGTTAPTRPDPVTLVPDRSLTAQPSR